MRQIHGLEPLGGAPDLAGPGQEDEHVAGFVAQGARDVRGDRGLDAVSRQATGRAVQVAGFHRVLAPLGRDHRRGVAVAQQFGDRRGVEGRRHDQQAQVVAKQSPRLERQRQAEIGVQRALVELVEDHQPDAVEPRIGLQHARQDALGDHLDAGAGADPGVAADAVADRLADLFAQQCRHASRRGAGGEAARLENDDLAALEPLVLGPRVSSSASGTTVVLPAPGGATRTAEARAVSASRSGSRISRTGRSGSCTARSLSAGRIPGRVEGAAS